MIANKNGAIECLFPRVNFFAFLHMTKFILTHTQLAKIGIFQMDGQKPLMMRGASIKKKKNEKTEKQKQEI